LEPISGKESNEESVTRKSEPKNVGSPVDEGKTKPMKVYDSVKGGDTIWTDWGLPLLKCIRDTGKTTDKKVKQQVLKYMSIDDELYRRTIDGVLLKCLGEEQAKVAVSEVHDGVCRANQLTYKMNWLLRRAGFYWLIMMDDCVKYEKGYEACQRFGNIQLASAGVMNSIVKPGPFRGWGLDFIGEIHPGSSKGHRFILVATDYFTNWIKTVPLRNMTHREVISFVQEHMIYQFGIPQTLTIDQGPSFMSRQFKEFTEFMKKVKVEKEVEKEMLKIAKAYNKCVVEKTFQVGDLVWKTILPLGTRSGMFGKWSPSWKGPLRVTRVVMGNAYFVEDLEGHSLLKALNRKYLKCYYSSMWQDR
jgi:hypothetical protein